MAKSERKEFAKKIDAFKKDLTSAFGHTIRKPLPAILGAVNSDSSYVVNVPASQSDEPNEYYFSQAGSTSFRGKAQLKTGTVPHNYLRYGTPIRLLKDVLTGRWEIIGLDTTFAAIYYQNVEQEEVRLFTYQNIAFGLIRSTTPNSMQITALAASYNIGTVWKYINNFFSSDWSQAPASANVPATLGKQRFVLVAMDFLAETLFYSYGSEHSITYSFQDALDIDKANSDNALLPVPTSVNHFRLGYVRLYYGQSIIQDGVDIYPMHDLLTSGGGGVDSLANIVVTDDDVVVSNGEVVWVDTD